MYLPDDISANLPITGILTSIVTETKCGYWIIT